MFLVVEKMSGYYDFLVIQRFTHKSKLNSLDVDFPRGREEGRGVIAFGLSKGRKQPELFHKLIVPPLRLLLTPLFWPCWETFTTNFAFNFSGPESAIVKWRSITIISQDFNNCHSENPRPFFLLIFRKWKDSTSPFNFISADFPHFLTF